MTNDNVSLRLVKGDASSVGIRYFYLLYMVANPYIVLHIGT